MIDLAQQPFFATDHTPESVTRWIEQHDDVSKMHLYVLQGIYWNAIVSALAKAHSNGEELRLTLASGESFIYTPAESTNAQD